MSQILIDAGPSPRGWHRLEAFLRCPQLYGWGYGRAGSTFGPTVPLARGAIGHVGLAHLYARVKWCQERSAAGERPDLAACPYFNPIEAMERAAGQLGELGASQLPVAIHAVRGYADRYGAEPFEIVGVESPAETLFHGHRYTARIDLTVRDAAGKVWILDHKFVSRIESKVSKRYTLSGQFLGLAYLGAKLYGPAFGGIRLNLVGCMDGRFERITPEPAPWMLARFPEIVKYAEEGIARVEAAIARGEVIPASPSEHTCLTSYGECPAFERCRWGEQILPDFEEVRDAP